MIWTCDAVVLAVDHGVDQVHESLRGGVGHLRRARCTETACTACAGAEAISALTAFGVDARVGGQQRGERHRLGDRLGREELREGRGSVLPGPGAGSGAPGASGGPLWAAATARSCRMYCSNTSASSAQLDHHVPVAVPVARGGGISRLGDGIDGGLVGVVPVAAGQPERGLIRAPPP